MASKSEQYAPDPAILEYYGTYYNEIDRFNKGTHRPEELAVEITECGFAQCQTFAVESAAWLLGDIQDQLEDPERREILLDAIQKIETEPSLLGASPHIMAMAKKP